MIAASAVAAIATGVIAGWCSGVEPLMTVLPGLIRMKSNTAGAFLLAATALYLEHKQEHRRLQAICSSLVALVGAITLIEYFGRINAGVDQLLFRDPVQFPFPGRMAHITAVNFLLIGAMLYPFRFRARDRVTNLLALIVGFGSTFGIVGYLYGVPLLYGSIRYTAMAMHTGLAFLLLAVGFLYARKEHGLAHIFQAQTSGGMVARQLIPAAILIPIIVGAVFNKFNFGQPKLGMAFIVVCNVLLLVAAIWILAYVLDKSEIERNLAQQASELDGLTCVNNRRYFDRGLSEEIHRCVRYSRDSSLILFDIDHFKNLNDGFGHLAGDNVLRTIAQACQGSLRACDVICRYGGEEFAIIAPETSVQNAMVLARKVRNLVGLLTFDKAPVRVTISLGVAPISRYAASSEAVIATADQALYAAKKLGRNRECSYADIEGLELPSEKKDESDHHSPAFDQNQQGVEPIAPIM